MFIKLLWDPWFLLLNIDFSQKANFYHILLYQWIAIYTSIRSVKLIYA